MKNYLVACFFIGLFSCNNQQVQNVDSATPIRYPSPNAMYQRDSTYIVATIEQFIDKEVSYFNFAKQYNLPLNKIEIYVDTILYSPDTLKMVTFVIKKMPDMEAADTNVFYYSGGDLKGFRSSTKEPWHIYPNFHCGPSGLPEYNSVRRILHRCCFEELKTESTYVWDSSKMDLILESYRYNMDEKDFWDSSVLWRKGARTAGAYIFQNRGTVKPWDENPVQIIPKLDYPDSLLDLYK